MCNACMNTVSSRYKTQSIDITVLKIIFKISFDKKYIGFTIVINM